MIAFARIAGPLLLLVFGSEALILGLRERLVDAIEGRLEGEQSYIFVEVSRGQRLRSYEGTRYFIAYTGTHEGYSFQHVEEVPAAYFHRHSVGANVECEIFEDAAGNLYTHLRGNSFRPRKEFARLRQFSLIMSVIGLALLLFGFLRPFRRAPPIASVEKKP